MFARLLTYSVSTDLGIGRRILPRARVDTRLADAASVLEAAFNDLETSAAATETAWICMRDRQALRDESRRHFVEVVREFGVVVLSAGGNHFDIEPYVIYFPDGYGPLRRMMPRELIQFAGRIVTMLEKDTKPKFASYRQLILDACADFTSAQETYEESVRAWTDARAYQKASRRRFVRALGRAWSLSEAACDEEPGYIKSIFLPAFGRRRSAPEDPEAVETPGEGETSSAPRVAPSPELTVERVS